ncbi:pseudouridine synthase [Polynucleobacter sp. QLW-P1DATA-2]|uniref:pseudouridine synthase n=1 Tax=unclassified Polynucleobacter TaxID=2640945 RepID=UPI0008F7EE91|nr:MULTISPECIES: pseudouridine synthase [unclassified Polynucleobacter]OIN01271.1 pseudouridine synthase [Polynucleobacter sp. QLW-P1DATA-2]OIN02842.1 pseudouridine synthase [Polynucleobacter sp. MWH-Tro8-2-5-gr]
MSIQVNSEGVSASRVFLPADQTHSNLLEFFIAQFPHIRAVEWEQRFDEGLILNMEGETLSAKDPYQPNTHLMYFRRLAREPEIPFEEQILFQDEHILVADKPHFLPVTPSGLYLHQTLLNRLKKKTGIPALSPIHRIDRDTAGLVIFSVNPDERAQYQNLFRDRVVKKVYEAIAPYSDALIKRLPMTYQSKIEESEHFLQMQEVQGEPNTDTLIELIQINQPWAKYRLTPGSGKKHQLRCHLNVLGVPIKHDQIYPILTPYQEYELDISKPLQLLAKEIAFDDPITKQMRSFGSQQKLEF